MPTTTFYTPSTLSTSSDTSVHNLYFMNETIAFRPQPFTWKVQQVLDTTSNYYNPYPKNLQVGDEFIYTANGNYYTSTNLFTNGGNLNFRFYKNGVATIVHNFYLPHALQSDEYKYNITIQQIVKENSIVFSNATLIIFDDVQFLTSQVETSYDFSTPGDFGTMDTLNVEFRNLDNDETPYMSLNNLKIKILPFR